MTDILWAACGLLLGAVWVLCGALTGAVFVRLERDEKQVSGSLRDSDRDVIIIMMVLWPLIWATAVAMLLVAPLAYPILWLAGRIIKKVTGVEEVS
jgi:hypothetical protein